MLPEGLERINDERQMGEVLLNRHRAAIGEIAEFNQLVALWSLEKGEFDLVAVGRALLQDPEWATKVKEGRTEELEDYDAKAMATLY